ncbi:Pseudouridine synthase RluB [Alteracholeplasma palmae J233]|uniref:Pseudouridine synthase n=1 Tax=Alteracholeplasma palmae (strain ATCC 49389 / J233) TaxID=1318466 RepID=U4KLC3_ALTPJ|nr:pseudouridine synthase [Alteracholeplasma palmae]CCV64593.1 Pseudouridine synthase RluB [Alteracholeplasma palmae J233]
MLKAIFDNSISVKNQNLIEHDKKESVRLNKYISDSGIVSRREADRLIIQKKVKINGKIAETGMQVLPSDIVTLDNKVISVKNKKVYLALNKPEGIVCITDTTIKNNIITFMDYKETIFPIGRLDKDSCGLILLTNDGDIVNKILRSENNHDKEYYVEVDRAFDDDFVLKMESGVTIYNPVTHKNQKTLPSKVKRVSHKAFHLTINQGLNLQIRRMCKALGYHVNFLERIRIMNIHLKDLKKGHYRLLTEDELKDLNSSINYK